MEQLMNAVRLIDRATADATSDEMKSRESIELCEGVHAHFGYREGKPIVTIKTPDDVDNFSAVFFLDPNAQDD